MKRKCKCSDIPHVRFKGCCLCKASEDFPTLKKKRRK